MKSRVKTKELKNLIRQNYSEEVVYRLLDSLQSDQKIAKFENEIIIMASQVQDIQQRRMLGLKISIEEQNEMKYSLLQIIDKINEVDQSLFQKIIKEPQRNRYVNNGLKVFGGSVLYLLILSSINTILIIIMTILIALFYAFLGMEFQISE